MTFAALCLLLVSGTVAYIVAPIARRSRRHSNVTAAEANAAVYRDRLSELSTERQHELLTDRELALEQDDLERRLLADVPATATKAASRDRHRQRTALLWISVLILPIAVATLYVTLGSPALLAVP